MYGAGAVALIFVPLTVTAAPSPFGQAAGEGNVPKLCAVEQLSLAGCAYALRLIKNAESIGKYLKKVVFNNQVVRILKYSLFRKTIGI